MADRRGGLLAAPPAALFAIGLRALNPPAPADEAVTGRPTAGPVGHVVAGLCFAAVLAAIGWGISVIVGHS